MIFDFEISNVGYFSGYFEFRLCKHNSMGTRVQQSCFDDGILLTVRDTGDTRYDINYNKQENYYFRLDMPRNVTCSQCVLQWKYNTGKYGAPEETFLFRYLSSEKLKQEYENGNQNNKYLV